MKNALIPLFMLLFALAGMYILAFGVKDQPNYEWYLERKDGSIERCKIFSSDIERAVDQRTGCIPRKDIHCFSIRFPCTGDVLENETWKTFYRVSNGVKKEFKVCEPDYIKKYLKSLPDKTPDWRMIK